jgi:hypothetical protein
MPTSLPPRSRASRHSTDSDPYGGLLACIAVALATLLLTSMTLPPTTSAAYTSHSATGFPSGKAGLEQFAFIF